MIVPGQRLILTAAFAGVPIAVLIGLGGTASLIGAIGLVASVCLITIDLVISRDRTGRIRVLLPGRVNLFKGRAGAIEVQVLNETEMAAAVRLGLNVPPTISSASADLRIELPAGVAASHFKWPCTATERGRYQIPSVHLELTSRLGFWSIRAAQKTAVELRVFPDLLSERKRVASTFLRGSGVGARAQRRVGKGRDFEKLRDYLPGDPVEDVHWKATAKRGRPVTKLFQIERTQEVYVAIDCSRLTARGDGPESELQSRTVLERFITAALLLGVAAEQGGDNFGLITFSDRVHKVIRARNGHAHFTLCRDSLYDLQSRPVSPDFDEVCSAIRVRLRKRALIVFLTALDDPLIAEGFVKASGLLSRQHLLIVNMMQPSGARPLFDRHMPPPGSAHEIYHALAGHMSWLRFRELARSLEVRGVKMNVVANENLTSQLIAQYIEVKERQIL